MDKKTGTAISRREFARRAAIASAVASWAPVNAVAAVSSLPAAQSQQPPNLPKLSPEGQAEAEARFQAILGQYGTRFSEEQKADLRRLCTMAQPPLDRLRAYAVENGVSPALYLKPLIERQKKPAAAKPPTASAAPGANASPPGKAPPASKKP